MKNLLTFLVIGSLVALSGVYFELWTIPRLENFPTISQPPPPVSRQPQNAPKSREIFGKDRLNQDLEDAPPSGPLGLDRSKSARARQLEESRRHLER